MLDLFAIILRPEILLFSIPIVAIISRAYLKGIKMRTERRLHHRERNLIEQLRDENLALQERIQNLDFLVTGTLEEKRLEREFDRLSLPSK